MSKPKTFIEVWSPWMSPGTAETNFYASRNIVRKPDGTLWDFSGWYLNGSDLVIADKEDLKGIQLLLDEIEKEFNESE